MKTDESLGGGNDFKIGKDFHRVAVIEPEANLDDLAIIE
jgi:hypothetical protein